MSRVNRNRNQSHPPHQPNFFTTTTTTKMPLPRTGGRPRRNRRQRQSERGPPTEGGGGRPCRSSTTGNDRPRCCSLSSSHFHLCSRLKGALRQSFMRFWCQYLVHDLPLCLCRCHPDAAKYIKNFSKHRNELARILFDLYNEEVFAGGIQDGTEIVWKPRLRKTAGRCHQKKRRQVFSTGQ